MRRGGLSPSLSGASPAPAPARDRTSLRQMFQAPLLLHPHTSPVVPRPPRMAVTDSIPPAWRSLRSNWRPGNIVPSHGLSAAVGHQWTVAAPSDPPLHQQTSGCPIPSPRKPQVAGIEEPGSRPDLRGQRPQRYRMTPPVLTSLYLRACTPAGTGCCPPHWTTSAVFRRFSNYCLATKSHPPGPGQAPVDFGGSMGGKISGGRLS